MTKIHFKDENYRGEYDYYFDESELTPLHKKLLEKLNDNNKELIYWFLTYIDEETEEELKQLEKSMNTAAFDLEPIDHYACNELGTTQTYEELFGRNFYVWSSYLFIESTDMDYMTIVNFRHLRERIKDADELLYWTCRMCLWGGYDFYYPYTLYLGILNGRYEKYHQDKAPWQ